MIFYGFPGILKEFTSVASHLLYRVLTIVNLPLLIRLVVSELGYNFDRMPSAPSTET